MVQEGPQRLKWDSIGPECTRMGPESDPKGPEWNHMGPEWDPKGPGGSNCWLTGPHRV